MENFYKKSHQSGRSMIEMLGVLAIIGVLSVGGIAGYSKAMSKWKTSKALDEISMIVANVQTLFANKTKFAGLGTNEGAQMVYPSGMLVNGEAINVFGMPAEIGAGDDFWVMEYWIPADRGVCTAITTANWGTSENIRSLGVGTDCGFTEFNDFPVSLDKVGHACNCEDGTIDLIFQFH